MKTKDKGFKDTSEQILNIWRWAYGTNELTATQKLIIILLTNSIRTDLTTDKITHSAIALQSGLTRKTIANNLKQLLQSGYIEEVEPKRLRINYESIDSREAGTQTIFRVVNTTRKAVEYWGKCETKITSSNRLVMIAIVDHVRQDGANFICNPSYDRLVTMTNVKRHTISDSIKVLNKLGMINWFHTKGEGNRNSVNTYVISPFLCQGYPKKQKKKEPLILAPKLLPPKVEIKVVTFPPGKPLL